MVETNILHTGPLRAHLFDQIEKTLPTLETRSPNLMVILVGDDPASHVYVRNKKKTAEKLGMRSDVCIMPAGTTQEELHTKIDHYNNDPDITALLVQMPLPKHLDEFAALSRINPLKDVDGLTATNAGLLGLGQQSNALIPATPLGIMRFLEWTNTELSGAEAVILGRSNLVGRPITRLLGLQDATVTMCHSKTRDLDSHIKRADVLIAAVGKPNFVKGSQLKEGAVVVDVGINSIDAPETEKGYRLIGDVDTESCRGVARVITPVPGGVGPLTVSSLMTNVVDATCLQEEQPLIKWDAHAPMDAAVAA